MVQTRLVCLPLVCLVFLVGCGDTGGGGGGTGGTGGDPADDAVLADCSGQIQVPAIPDGTPPSFEILDDKALMRGYIDATVPAMIDELLRDHPEVTTIAMLNVPGSNNDNATRAAGRKVRAAALSTCLVRGGIVASGGVDFFLSGARRKIIEGRDVFVGVHSWEDAQGRQATEYDMNDSVHNLFIDYYTEMGLEEGFYWFTINAASFESIHWMTKAEREQWGVETETEPPSAEGQFQIEWTGNNDADLEVIAPDGVTCTRRSDSTGGTDLQTEIVDCLNAQGEAVSGIYGAIVTNKSDTNTQSITFKSPPADNPLEVTRDYAPERVRSIFVARTTKVTLEANWTSDESPAAEINVDLELYQNSTFGQGPVLDVRTPGSWMGCSMTGSVLPGNSETIECTSIPRDVYQVELEYKDGETFTAEATAALSVLEGGEGLATPDFTLRLGDKRRGFFFFAAGPVE